MSLIEFKNVSKIYKLGEVEIPALSGVDFTVEEGEFVVVLGASGAGKSTILNILGGMDSASGGQVMVAGEDITQYNQKKLTMYRREKVGFVFQFYNLITNLNALENVEFAASVAPNHLDPAETLDAVGLSDRAANFPAESSNAWRSRVRWRKIRCFCCATSRRARSITKRAKWCLNCSRTSTYDTKKR